MSGPRNGPTYGDLYGHEPGYAVHGFLALQQAISESIATNFTPTTNNAQVGCACVCVISACPPVLCLCHFCLPSCLVLHVFRHICRHGQRVVPCVISACPPVWSDFCLPASMFLTIQIIHNMEVQRFPFPRKTAIPYAVLLRFGVFMVSFGYAFVVGSR